MTVPVQRLTPCLKACFLSNSHPMPGNPVILTSQTQSGQTIMLLTHPGSRALLHRSACLIARPSVKFSICRTRGCSKVTAAASTVQTPPALLSEPWSGSEAQQKALADLSSRMQHCQYGTADKATLQWFLRDRKLDVGEAEQKLINMLKWRQEFRADSVTAEDVAQEAATGKAYVHRHKDVLGRPVIVIKVSKHIIGEYPLEDSKRLCVHLLESALQQLDNGQETVLGVFDLRGFSNRNSDLGFVRFLVDIFFTYYPKRLGQVVFLNAPWIFQPGWAIVKPWLGKYAGLVRFVKLEELREQFFTPETCPDDFKE